ncbi:hypothetical protein Tsubulata_033875 [Turnera subulata]|uniref:Light-regulated protein n=1 Tax=Turnera subulata TaxID=218843 RepID=A0A9Q0G8M7_9ROSI|nr:hypothetical protein Tsubulata_033875 [Turnera subulata]
MQAALNLVALPLPIVRPTKTFALPLTPVLRVQAPKCSPIKATPPVANDTSTVDYSSTGSVFPAEACETIGGEACDVEMYPEAKLKQDDTATTARTASEQIDREYLDYNGPKTVFREEACDDLGGEFCEPDFQKEP